MNKLNLITWDILMRVYYCLFKKQVNYRIITTFNNDSLEKITVADDNFKILFSIDASLKIEVYGIEKTNEEIVNCFKANGIHASI